LDGGGQHTNIYLKNFPDVSQEEIQRTLETFCGQFGTITSILVKTNSDIAKNFAFVCYGNNEQANAAFEALKTRSPFPGEPLYVNWAESRAERNKKLKNALSSIQNETNLFVKNLKGGVDKASLEEAFSVFGVVTSCDVRSPQEGSAKSIVPTKFGFVNF
jgi:RNA recognition motif-containing protein